MAALTFGLAVLALYMTALFAIATARRNNGTADIGYGIAYIALVSAVAFASVDVAPISRVYLLMVVIWGLRLALRIAAKNHGKPEDFRYKAWRDAWGKGFFVRSFLQVYMLQGLVVFVVALPVTLSFAYPSFGESSIFLYLGVLVWTVGYLFEAVGDAQLDTFVKDSANKGKIMMSGLWKYTRHPNYFGESLMWWGLALASISTTQLWPIALLSPVLITYLLRFVSGVPLLEKRWEGNPEWEAYKVKTPAMLPSLWR